MSAVYDDAVSAIVAYLQTAGTTLYSACGTNIWNGKAQSGWTNTTPAVVCIDLGGDERVSSPIREWTLQCNCYGGSENPQAAKQVYNALRDILKRKSSLVIGNITITCVGRPRDIPGTEPDTTYPVVNGFFPITSQYTA